MTNFRKTKVIKVIETVCLEGGGVISSPYREIVYYHDLEGNQLAVYDSWKEQKKKNANNKRT